jgi:hypothetical protein
MRYQQSVDPSGGNDEVGIVASALLNDGRFAVLADRTATIVPDRVACGAIEIRFVKLRSGQ